MEMKKLEERLPLHWDNHTDSRETSFIADTEHNFIAKSVYNHDAQYIVKAVNNYGRAIELLEESVRQIDYLHDKFKETGTGNAVKLLIQTFLDEQKRQEQPNQRDSEG